MTLPALLESCRTALGAGARWRTEALQRALELGLPDRDVEDWKYSAPTALAQKRFALDGQASADVSAWRLAGFEGALIVLVNGRYRPELSSGLSNAIGVELDDSHQELEQGSSFTRLNTALSTPIALRVGDNVAEPNALHVLYLAVGGEIMSHPRLRIRLGRNSRLTLIEHFAGDAGEYLCNAVTEVELAERAQLEHHRLQEHGSAAHHVGSLHVRQSRSSRFTSVSADLGGAWVRNDVFVDLFDQGAEAHLHGVYVPFSRQHMDNHTRIDHRAPNGTSREGYKGILDGHGRGVFNGKIIVHQDAQKTDSEQSSAALLLSRTAEVDAKPELEIYADDVKCKHGATVGQLDEDAVFYLQSRGLGAEAARSLLTYSFAEEIIGRIAVEPLRRRIESALLARLPGAAQFEGLLQ